MTTDPEAWSPTCVICAAKGRERKLDHGHCCAACRTRIDDDLAEILRLAADAAAFIEPGTTSTDGGHSVPASRPPINLDALDPELTIVLLEPSDPSSATTVLEVIEEWERIVRDERGFAPYGPASLARRPQKAREGTVDGLRGSSAINDTRVTLTGCIGFLRAQGGYTTTVPTFGLEQYAREIRLCVNALRKWDLNDDRPRGTVIKCPTILAKTNDDGTDDDPVECAAPLRFQIQRPSDGGRIQSDEVRCPRCAAVRTVNTLLAIAVADGREVWLGSEDAARWLGISERTLMRWANEGKVRRERGRYQVREAVA